MSKKALKALESIKKEIRATYVDEEGKRQYTSRQDDDERYIIIKQALTPPTAEEVCKALSDYLRPHYIREVKVTFENGEFVFFDRILVQNIGGDIWLNFPIDFPPHLVTLICRFYEGVSDE